MKNKFLWILGICVILVSIAAIAQVVWVLLVGTTVATCFDSDGGLVESVTGTASGVTLGGTFFSQTDFCASSSDLREFACSGGQLQMWRPTNITCNCVSGACI